MLKALYGDQRGSGGGKQKQISLPTREEASALCITPTTEEEKKKIDKILSSWGKVLVQKEEARILVKQFGIVGLAHQAIWNPSTSLVAPLLHWIGIPEVLPRKASEFLHAASCLHDPELKEIAKDAFAHFIYACRDEPEPQMEGMDTVLSSVHKRKSLTHAFERQVNASLIQRRLSFHEQFMLFARGTRSSMERAHNAGALKNELARDMERVSNEFAAAESTSAVHSTGIMGAHNSGGPDGPGASGTTHATAAPAEPWDIKVRSLEAQKHALKLKIDEVCIALEGSVHIQKEMMREAGGLQRNQEMLKHQALAEELGTCQEAVGAYGEVNLISSLQTELSDLITHYEQESMTHDNDESYEQPLLDALAAWDQAVGDHVSFCASWDGRLQKEAAESRERSLLLDVSDNYDGSELAISAQALENALATLHHSQDESVRSSWTTATKRSRVKNDTMQEHESSAFDESQSSLSSTIRHDVHDLGETKGRYQSMGLEAHNDNSNDDAHKNPPYFLTGTFQGDDGQQKSFERISRRMSLMLPPVEHASSMEVHKRRSLPLPCELGLTDAPSQIGFQGLSPGGDSHLGDTTPIGGSRKHITGLDDF